KEINGRLLEREHDKVFKYQKYPLIALACPTPEQVIGDVIEYTLNIAILDFTERNYNAEERMENVFKPVLFPLYEKFMKELRNSGLFMWDGNQSMPPHIKINRYYWGTQSSEGNEANIFSDPLDAIEIVNLKIRSLLNNC